MRIAHPSTSEQTALRWGHLDPDVLESLETANAAVSMQSISAESAGYDFVGSAFAACTATLLVALYSSVVFHWGGPSVTLTLVALPAGLGLVFNVSRRGTGNRSRWLSRRERVRADSLLLAVRRAGASLSPIENIYADIALAVLRDKTADWQVASRWGARGILRECNVLIADYRRLERQAEVLQSQRALVTEAEAELSALNARVAAESDPVALDALRQGVLLCTDRLEGLRKADIPAVRVEAQMQAILQAFRLLRSSLASVQVSHSGGPMQYSATAASIDRVHELASRLSAQAQAAEAATAELIQL